MTKALIIVTNGEARGEKRNSALLKLTASLQNHEDLRQKDIDKVSCCVLSGKPTVSAALQQAAKTADHILIYPLFMSEGYFLKTALPSQIASSDISTPITMLPSLSSDPALPPLLYQKALETLRTTQWQIEETRLLIVGHGSSKNPASAQATRRQARNLITSSQFLGIETAFLEEEPFIEELLGHTKQLPTIIIGYFTGQGLHGKNDIEQAIETTGANAVYADSIGSAPEIKHIILAAVLSNKT